MNTYFVYYKRGTTETGVKREVQAAKKTAVGDSGEKNVGGQGIVSTTIDGRRYVYLSKWT